MRNLRFLLFKSIIVLVIFSAFHVSLSAQKVAFISSDDIRKNFPEAKQSDQRVNTIVEEWKRELETVDKNIEILEFEIKKNRLVWSDEEKEQKEQELTKLRNERLAFARNKFEAGGEYEKIIREIMKPIEEKIYAAVQETAQEEGYDIVFDKSVQPLPFVNFKYDLTVKVLKRLGVDVEKLEKEQEEKISKDPRNMQSQPKEPPKRKSRSRTHSEQPREMERETQPDENVIQPNMIQPPDSLNPRIN